MLRKWKDGITATLKHLKYKLETIILKTLEIRLGKLNKHPRSLSFQVKKCINNAHTFPYMESSHLYAAQASFPFNSLFPSLSIFIYHLLFSSPKSYSGSSLAWKKFPAASLEPDLLLLRLGAGRDAVGAWSFVDKLQSRQCWLNYEYQRKVNWHRQAFVAKNSRKLFYSLICWQLWQIKEPSVISEHCWYMERLVNTSRFSKKKKKEGKM